MTKVELRFGGSAAIDNISYGLISTGTSVPEPLSLSPFATALAGLGWMRRRNQK